MIGYNFTERVRKVLAMAREEAARLHHDYVGTEHPLLGLLREEKGIAAQVLTDTGINLDAARTETQRLLGTEATPGASTARRGNTPGQGEAGAEAHVGGALGRVFATIAGKRVPITHTASGISPLELARDGTLTGRRSTREIEWAEEELGWRRLEHVLDLADRLEVKPAIAVVSDGLLVRVSGHFSVIVHFGAGVQFGSP